MALWVFGAGCTVLNTQPPNTKSDGFTACPGGLGDGALGFGVGWVRAWLYWGLGFGDFCIRSCLGNC